MEMVDTRCPCRSAQSSQEHALLNRLRGVFRRACTRCWSDWTSRSRTRPRTIWPPWARWRPSARPPAAACPARPAMAARPVALRLRRTRAPTPAARRRAAAAWWPRRARQSAGAPPSGPAAGAARSRRRQPRRRPRPPRRPRARRATLLRRAAFFPDLLVLLKARRVRVRTLPRRPLASRTCRCCSRRAGSLQVRVLVDVGQCVPQPRAPCRV
jgi:hypothetical protein